MARSTWTTKDGKVIPIREMTARHLINTIRYLERQHERAVLAIALDPPDFQGEMAQVTADSQYNAILDSEPADMFPVYEDLVLERSRRGL